MCLVFGLLTTQRKVIKQVKSAFQLFIDLLGLDGGCDEKTEQSVPSILHLTQLMALALVI